MPLVNKIAELPNRTGLSLYEIAKRSKISLSTIYRLAGDKTQFPRPNVMEGMIAGLGVELSDLVEYLPSDR